jgi:NADH dehydrogenase [ubiquinone] 1 alpha subcomplex assembly factor 7
MRFIAVRTVLEDFLKDDIKARGPMSVAAFMTHVLAHPQYGYYMTRDPFGETGDFTTAPEISQIFGEMVAVWLYEAWRKCGAPTAFYLVECGPGRGTLMADMVRVLSRMPDFVSGAEIVLVEMSPVLKAKQERALKECGMAVRWVADFTDIPIDKPVFVIANEFLDALPVHQLCLQDGQWMERVVDCKGERFVFDVQHASDDLEALAVEHCTFAGEGDLVELSPARTGFMKDVAVRIAVSGGAGLFIDYGYTHAQAGDSLQAMYKHKAIDVLDKIGEADLTAHVDFGALAGIAREAGCGDVQLVEQGYFLQSLGGDVRLQALRDKAAGEAQKRDLESGYARLVEADQMGQLFKVLSFVQPVRG